MRYVYFIGASTAGGMQAIKIGVATNPHDRVRNLQCGSPTRLTLLAYVPGDVKLERRLHETFEPVALRGEWFARVGKLDSFLNYLEMDAEEAGCLELPFERFEVAISDNVANESWMPNSLITEREYEATASRGIWVEYE